MARWRPLASRIQRNLVLLGGVCTYPRETERRESDRIRRRGLPALDLLAGCLPHTRTHTGSPSLSLTFCLCVAFSLSASLSVYSFSATVESTTPSELNNTRKFQFENSTRSTAERGGENHEPVFELRVWILDKVSPSGEHEARHGVVQQRPREKSQGIHPSHSSSSTSKILLAAAVLLPTSPFFFIWLFRHASRSFRVRQEDQGWLHLTTVVVGWPLLSTKLSPAEVCQRACSAAVKIARKVWNISSPSHLRLLVFGFWCAQRTTFYPSAVSSGCWILRLHMYHGLWFDTSPFFRAAAPLTSPDLNSVENT